MSAHLVAPVVPPIRPSGRASTGGPGTTGPARGLLPLPALIAYRTSTVVYGLAALDNRGRIADHVIMRALGWPAGQHLHIHEAAGILTICTADDGAYQVTNQGHLRLPALLRHRCSLQTGDRVLLAADPERSRLVVYPPAALDSALPQQPVATPGGESA